MIEAYRCDRCGLVFHTHKMDQKGVGITQFTLDGKTAKDYHLCTQCAVEFAQFMDTGWEEEKRRLRI